MHPGIYYNNILADFYGCHIFADFFHSAKRDNTNYAFLYWWNFFICDFILVFCSKWARSSALPKSFLIVLISGTFCYFFSALFPCIIMRNIACQRRYFVFFLVFNF